MVNGSDYNEQRYLYHHGMWINTSGEVALRHLYALRAHLKALGWLDKKYNVPGYGVARV